MVSTARYLTIASALAYFASGIAHGGGWSSKGELALAGRAFTGDGNSATKDWGAGLDGRLELAYRRRPVKFKVRAFGRVDSLDPRRNLVVFEEGWFSFRRRWFRIRAGAQMLSWSATEAFHPADVLNSRNFDSNLENPEKIGEPMVDLSFRIGSGRLSLFYMPLRMAPRLPAGQSRLSFLPAGTELNDVLWLDRDGTLSRGQSAHQLAMRFTQRIPGGDLGLHFVRHQDRQQPMPVLDPQTGRITPVYHPVTQVGATWRQVFGSWVTKFEAAYRWFDNPERPTRLGLLHKPDHAQIAVGLEYGWNYEGGADGTILLEGQTLVGPGPGERAFLHPFQRDLLIGYRHAFNDEMGKELLFTVVADVERGAELLFNLQYSQRISNTWRIRAALRFIHAPPRGGFPLGLQALHHSNQINFTLVRSF